MSRKYEFLFWLCTFFLIVFRVQGQGGRGILPNGNNEPGYLDIRSADLNGEPTPLAAKWKFYWHELRTPGQAPSYFEAAQFPHLWKNVTWRNKPISTDGYATYELSVLLPKTSEPLGLSIPDVYCAYNLYANGKLIARNGVAGTTKETTKPYWIHQVKPLFIKSDTLKLVFQVSNFHHSKGGPVRDIELGLLSELLSTSNADHAYDYFLTGCIFMAGFFFLGLYLFGKHDKAILYFSLFCLSYTYRIGGSRQYTLHSMFPDLDWGLAVHCEYISLFLAVGFFALYTKHLYPEDTPGKLLSLVIVICFLFAGTTLVTPPMLFTRLIDPFMVVVIVYIGVAAAIYFRAARNKRIGAKYAVVSTAAIFIIIIAVILEYYAFVTPFDIILFAGYLIFFFCQSLILTFRFAYTLKKAKEEAELGLKVKSEFLSTMSHEIRTPLNSVIGMTHFMLRESPRPDQKEHLDALLFSANNLLAIVNDVLDFSTIEEGKILFNNGPVDLVSIVQRIMAGYKAGANNPNIDFIVDIDPRVPELVSSDQTRLSQVIGNLVNNAVKFTAAGHVKTGVKQLSRTEKMVTLKIFVEDTGIGIPADKQELIFERFTQVDSSASRVFSGTGLGLTICKRILELQNIELLLESELGKGSTFYFVHSYTILKDKLPQVNSAAEASLPLSGVHILVVEDNPMNILVVQNFLKRWGATSDVAHNGAEALEKLDSSRHRIVLMDLHMPVMDGYEATRQIRANKESIPIVALTASVALDVENEVFAIGINEIVIKPFVPDHLLRVILSFVGTV
jgi:signal transduction histidine kinase